MSITRPLETPISYVSCSLSSRPLLRTQFEPLGTFFLLLVIISSIITMNSPLTMPKLQDN